MSLPTYVVNWDELAEAFTADININLEDIGGTLDTKLPEIIDLLEQIRDVLYQNGAKYKNYNQKIDGFHIKTDTNFKTIDWINEKNCYLTGITCSHSHVEGVDDFFMLSLIKLDDITGEEIAELIFNKVFLKDTIQHKYFNKYFPVPANTVVRIKHSNPSNLDKHVWYDIEYLEFFGLREDESWDDIPPYKPTEYPEEDNSNGNEVDCNEVLGLSFNLVPFDEPLFDNGIPVSAGIYIHSDNFINGSDYDVFGYKFKLSVELKTKKQIIVAISGVDSSTAEYHKDFKVTLTGIEYMKKGEDTSTDIELNKEVIVDKEISFTQTLDFDICDFKSEVSDE